MLSVRDEDNYDRVICLLDYKNDVHISFYENS